MTHERNRQQRSAWLLAIGAVIGLVLAAIGLMRTDRGVQIEASAIAMVGEVPVYRQAFERALAILEAERADDFGELDHAAVLDRAAVLGRLVDEELLVQRALELGLARSDRTVRETLVQAMVQSIVADSDGAEPSPTELEAFYDANLATFERPARYRVERLTLADPEQAEPARQALASGIPFAEAAVRWANPEAVPLPGDTMPVDKLRDYLGDDLAVAALGLEPGEVSAALRTPTGTHLLRLTAVIPASAPELAEIRPRVRAEYRRQASDAALRDYLQRMRERADVQLADDAPELDPEAAGRLDPGVGG